MKKRRTVVLLVAAGLVLSGCGLVPSDGQAVKVPKAAVPFGLSSAKAPVRTPSSAIVIRPIWLIDASKHLAPLSRSLVAPAQLEALLETLIDGPSLVESESGYTTALPPNFEVQKAVLSSTSLTRIYLNTRLRDLLRQSRVLAFGQLVLSAYDDGATDGVSFYNNNKVIDVPVPTGGSATILRASTYSSLVQTATN